MSYVLLGFAASSGLSLLIIADLLPGENRPVNAIMMGSLGIVCVIGAVVIHVLK